MSMFIWGRAVSRSNNQNGFSMMETMLALFFFSCIFLTIIPMTNDLYDQMQKRRMSLHAMHVNYEATKIYLKNPHQVQGEIQVDRSFYQWTIAAQQVCTTYLYKEERKSSCVKYK